MVKGWTFAALLIVESTAFAEGHAVAAKAGALGLGVEYTHELNERLAFRAGLNGSQYGFDQQESGIRYDFDLVWESLAIAVDFHPLRNPFRLSGGFLRNDNRFEAISRPTGNTTIGDTTYTPSQIGTLIGVVEFDDTAPLAGIGWDWSRSKNLFGISLDLGILSQGSPSVRLTGTGTMFSNPAFESDLRAEEAELEASLDDLDLVPYLTVGFVFRF
jgi:hypothetical protein